MILRKGKYLSKRSNQSRILKIQMNNRKMEVLKKMVAQIPKNDFDLFILVYAKYDVVSKKISKTSQFI